jgi:hypothetical protein
LYSQDIAETYSKLDIVVEAMLQFDMTMYAPATNYPVGIISDYTSPELSNFIELVTSGYTSLSYETSQVSLLFYD